MKFKELAVYLQKLEATPSRNAITQILSEVFRKSSEDEIAKIVYLTLGILAPHFQTIVLNIAERMMLVILSHAFDEPLEKVKALYKTKGDLGNVAEELARGRGDDPTVTEVFTELLAIAKQAGGGSQEKKISGMAKLLGRLDPLSVRYVARIPVGKLRLGFSDKTIIDALSVMEKGDKSGSGDIEKAYNIRPDIGYIARLVKAKGINNLATEVVPDVEIPVAPMLAQRLKSPQEMVTKMGVVSVEPKYDGLRIFIHYRRRGYPKKGNGEYLRTYTRNMNFIDNSAFPELVNDISGVGKHIKANEVILDTEAVGVDQAREKFLDFQTTIQRRRKHDVAKTAGEIPLQFQVFDILLKDGKSLLTTPYRQRREILKNTVTSGKLLRIDEHTITSDPNEIKTLHEKYVSMGLEGIIVKKADSLYVSGRTGWNWVKMKEAEEARGKLSDTVDVVIMGYTGGKGKRAEFGMGQFLAGVQDGDSFKTVTKVGTGLTDEQFRQLKARLEKIIIKDKPQEYEVHKDLSPDFWVSPEVVVELAADEVTESPKHTAGFALRFPRLVQFRDDKAPKDITTVGEIEDLFKLQRASV